MKTRAVYFLFILGILGAIVFLNFFPFSPQISGGKSPLKIPEEIIPVSDPLSSHFSIGSLVFPRISSGSTWRATQTEMADLENFLRDGMDGGWPFTIGKIIEKNYFLAKPGSLTNLYVKLAIRTYDGALFWRVKPEESSPEEYLKSWEFSLAEKETAWKFLSRWPGNSPSIWRIGKLMQEVLFRPETKTGAELAKSLKALFPSALSYWLLPMETVILSGFGIDHAVIMGAGLNLVSPSDRVIKCFSLIDLGFRWGFLKRFLENAPETFRHGIEGLALSSGDFDFLTEKFQTMESALYSSVLQDYVLAMDISQFKEKFGSRRDLLLLRQKAMQSFEKFIESRTTLTQNIVPASSPVSSDAKTGFGPQWHSGNPGMFFKGAEIGQIGSFPASFGYFPGKIKVVDVPK